VVDEYIKIVEMRSKLMSEKNTEFGKWRSFFWPIHHNELKKLIPMFLMFFFISMVYSTLRNLKDTLIITAPGSGAEALPFLKTGGVVPAAIIFMLIYAKLSNVLSKEKLFYVTALPFIIFYVLFATVLYPAKEYLHLSQETANTIANFLPSGWAGLVAAIRNWTYSLFYIFAELWGSFMLSLAFWGFANDITKVTEAKRFYGLFGIGANLALVCVDPMVRFINGLKNSLPESAINQDPWQLQLNYYTGVFVVAGIMVLVIYRWMQTNVLTDPTLYAPSEQSKVKKEKPKLSILDSFKFLLQSKYILCIAILVLAYNVSINLIEVTWKHQLHLQFPEKVDFSNFYGSYQSMLGWATIFMMLFISSNVLRRFGWAFTAYVTPVVLLITGALFFAFIFFKEPLSPLLIEMGTTPLMMAVIIGTIQNVMSKAAKYSLFDPTKEMAYIPLDQESKVKGKAAIDTVGARLGKAGGAGIQLGLMTMLGTIAAILPYIAAVLFIILFAWLWAVKQLGQTEFKPLEAKEKSA
jgi:AAA family ATP:ADP antiporter